MKKKLIYWAPLVLVILLSGCNGLSMKGSGILKDETRDISDFDALEADGAYSIEVICGKTPSLQIIGDDNIIPIISTEVSGGTLYISNKRSISPRGRITVKITTGNLNEIISAGASNIYVSGIKSNRFRVDASGAGKIELRGRVSTADYSISGAVKIDARDLTAARVNVDLSGASKADVYASEELKAAISGVGKINYYGNPGMVKRKISGLGSLTQM